MSAICRGLNVSIISTFAKRTVLHRKMHMQWEKRSFLSLTRLKKLRYHNAERNLRKGNNDIIWSRSFDVVCLFAIYLLKFSNWFIYIMQYAHFFFCVVAVWERISNFTPNFILCVITFLCGDLTHWGRDKWTPFRRRHFQMHFLERKCLNSD